MVGNLRQPATLVADRDYEPDKIREDIESRNALPFVGKTVPRTVFWSLELMSAGEVSDDTGAAALPGWLPTARSHAADGFREELKDKEIKAFNLRAGNPAKAIKYDKRRWKRRNRIEEIMFGKLKDRRRVATRYNRCPQTFLSAILRAANVLVRL